MASPTALGGKQKAVFEALRQADRPLGAYALLDLLRADGFNSPMQVYRALHALIEKGAIHRLETLNAYVPCIQRGGHGRDLTVFATCTACGRLREFADEAISNRLISWSRHHRFELTGAMIEVRGVCRSCQGGDGLGDGGMAVRT